MERIPDSLIDTLERAVERELDIQHEIKSQKKIRRKTRGTMSEGWRLNTPKIISGLAGAQFFADVFVKGQHLKEGSEALAQLRRSGDYPKIAKLIYKSLLEQILIHGRYHADLHIVGSEVRDYVDVRRGPAPGRDHHFPDS